MTEIKSALEIALEKTQGIRGDKTTLKVNELKNEGKKLASEYLDPVSKVDEGEVAGKFKSLAKEDKNPYIEGFAGVMIANITLPSSNSFPDTLKTLEKGLQLVIKDRKQLSYIFQQISQFFDQYLSTREQIEQGVKEQYEPKLREKERALEQQMGAPVDLTHEQDPEYLSLLSKNYARLDEQYNEALGRVKEQLEQMIKAGR